MAQIVTLLAQLENELIINELWQNDRPTAAELSSSQPFCVDTLRFEQWLQFIFIERFKALIAQGATLPTSISLCPMAEESFKHLGKNSAQLINTIGDIDELLSGRREQTIYVR